MFSLKSQVTMSCESFLIDIAEKYYYYYLQYLLFPHYLLGVLLNLCNGMNIFINTGHTTTVQDGIIAIDHFLWYGHIT